MSFKDYIKENELLEIYVSLMHFSIKPFNINWYIKNREGIHLTSNEYYMTQQGLTGPIQTNVTGKLKIKFLNHNIEDNRDYDATIADNQGYDAIADNKSLNDVYILKKSFNKLKFE